MNFNVYIDDKTAKQLGALARRRGKARNALVREAVEALLDRPSGSQWPDEVVSFAGLPSFAPFESQRKKLADAADDPFGGKR
jgi:hypothetical protein